MNQYVIWGGLGLANLPLIIVYGKLIFGDFQGFLDCLPFWFQPDFMSWWDGELFEDWWASFKLWIFVASCGAVISAEYAFLAPYLLRAVQAH